MPPSYLLSIAPMVGYTNSYYRQMLRLITKKTLLFTEMTTSGSILRGNQDKFLAFHPREKPVVFQIAGNEPQQLAECASIIEKYGYDGINLNIGCPSFKVQKGKFGVCLMDSPELVAESIYQMKKKTSLPISVKTRLGFDNNDSPAFLEKFISHCADAGCDVFFIHARKALLNLKPRKNRNIPPLRYNLAKDLKEKFPHLKIIINGGITSLEQAKTLLQDFDGVMIGRTAFQNPLLFQKADSYFFQGKDEMLPTNKIIDKFLNFVKIEGNTKLIIACRQLFNLFYAFHQAKEWRYFLHQQIQKHPNKPSPKFSLERHKTN